MLISNEFPVYVVRNINSENKQQEEEDSKNLVFLDIVKWIM